MYPVFYEIISHIYAKTDRYSIKLETYLFICILFSVIKYVILSLSDKQNTNRKAVSIMYKSLELFQESLAQESKSQNTINTYTRNITLFLNWLESVTKEPFNNKITQMDTQAYCKYLSDEKKMSLNTINSKLTSIKKFSDFLSDNGYMPYIKVVQKKGKTDPQVEVLEKNELYKYLRDTISSENKLHIAIVQLILNTGIRESELCSLEMDDITISDRKGTIIIRSGKGNKYRELPLNKDARNALADYIQNGRPETDTNKVFIGQRGAFNRNAIYKIINKIGQKSLGKNVYPHMLRHQCFTAMAKNPDVDLKTISELAGHSSVELTAKYYIHSSKEEKINAVESLSFF